MEQVKHGPIIKKDPKRLFKLRMVPTGANNMHQQAMPPRNGNLSTNNNMKALAASQILLVSKRNSLRQKHSKLAKKGLGYSKKQMNKE